MQIVFNEEQNADLNELAERMGLTRTAAVRYAIRQTLRKERREDGEA